MPQRAGVVPSDGDREALERGRGVREGADTGAALPGSCSRPGSRASRSLRGLAATGRPVASVGARIAERRLDGLRRRARARTISDEDVERAIVKTLEEQPPNAAHWSTRSMAPRRG